MGFENNKLNATSYVLINSFLPANKTMLSATFTLPVVQKEKRFCLIHFRGWSLERGSWKTPGLLPTEDSRSWTWNSVPWHMKCAAYWKKCSAYAEALKIFIIKKTPSLIYWIIFVAIHCWILEWICMLKTEWINNSLPNFSNPDILCIVFQDFSFQMHCTINPTISNHLLDCRICTPAQLEVARLRIAMYKAKKKRSNYKTFL